MNIGREDSLDEQIAALQEKVSRAKRLPWTASSSQVEYDQQRLNDLQEKKRQKDLQDAKEQAERNYQEQQKRRNAENAALNRMNESEAARHQREIARINAMQYADQAVRDAAIQRENERYEKALASGKKKTRETRNDEATRLLLQYSQQQAQVEGQIAAARQSAGIATEKMTEAHKQLLALQQRISDLDGKKLTADEKSVLARKDELIQALMLLDVKQQELQKQTALNDLKKKTIQLTSQLAEEERAQRQQHDLDNGAHFDGDQSGTVNGVTPPAVQHLTAEVTADSGEYQVLARWDTPKVVKGVSFLLRLTVTADDGSERLVSTARTTETTYRFRQLALGNYRLTVRAVNAWGQQGDPASVSFRIAAPAAPSRIELMPGYFQITATPHLAVYDPTVQFEFWFSETRITDIRQVETTARYLGTGLYWIAASINIKPGHDYYFYIRSVNTVGKSAFVEAVGRASDDAEGYLDFFKGQITESHLGKELLEKVELTEDNASRLEEFSKEWKDVNDKWNAMWGVKIEQTKDGKHYVAGIGLSMEDTEEGKLSQFLVAANRIAFIDPSNGNTRPMFVGQGDQIFMNDVFLKRLTAPTITSGGNPPAFSLTPDGRLTAKNADISGNVNANSGTLNNVTINENCRVLGKLSANQIEGDLVKTVGKAFPRDSRAPERWPSGTITVRVYDDQPFDRQIVIPAVAFSGAKHEREHTDIYSSCRLIVRKNGAEIYNRTALDNTLIYSGVIDMPAGHGHMTLEFSVSAWLVNDWYPTASISDLLVVVMKKATAGISIS
ncbi:phage tail tip protein [Escherichia coli]|uniref:phage tail tip domain-containing protein n=1 Tax=Escherichia coli TaxID=562 RepID=UPI00385D70C2